MNNPFNDSPFEALTKKQNRLIDEIEEHFGKPMFEVAEDPILSKDPFFIERDKEIDRLDLLISTELF